MNSEKTIEILRAVADKITAEKDYLTGLDNVIGDGDHGINMARGMGEVVKKLEGLADAKPGDILKNTGMTLVSTVGGASGPLYGTFFMRLGNALAGIDDVSMQDFLKAMQIAVDSVAQRGHSTQGEKTMLDAMYPSLEAMNAAFAEGLESKDILAHGVEAARKGRDATADIIATKGRASYLGERSIGHIDPGASSYTMMLEILGENI